MSDVGGKLSILLMKIVVITSMVVRFTLKAASKKNGLKKVVAKVMAMRRKEGKNVVIISLVIFLFKTTSTLKLFGFRVQYQFATRKMDMSVFCVIDSLFGKSLTELFSREPIAILIAQV